MASKYPCEYTRIPTTEVPKSSRLVRAGRLRLPERTNFSTFYIYISPLFILLVYVIGSPREYFKL